MSREETFSKVGFARAFATLAPSVEDSTMQIDVDTLTSVLEALPSYAEVDVTFIDDDTDRRRVYHLMARDIPGPGRRFTCLTTGTEWFDIGRILQARDDARYIIATKHGEEQPMLLVSL